jgi:ribosomal protein S18 acetylase RimI-like enzyme
MLPALFGPRVQALLGWLLLRQSNPYSSSKTLVITDRLAGGGAPPVIGAMVGSVAATARAESLRTAGQLARWYGPAVISRLPRLARAGAAVQSLRPDDFYLSHIAVLPAHRGRGAGAALLGAAEDRARRLEGRRLVLDVEEHNTGARAFYGRMGYRQASTVRIDLGRHGTFSFLRLARDL